MMDRMDCKIEKLSLLEAEYKYPNSWVLLQMVNADIGIVMRLVDNEGEITDTDRKNYTVVKGANV